MKFFVPDWDDRVDPGYDFLTDRVTLGRDPYTNDSYAHELVNERLYDGILVSRMALLNSGKKRTAVEKNGMRAFLRIPPEFELLGDCGAYGYVRERMPPFDTADVIAYYDRLGFDAGVSVDHLIVPEVDEQREFRYELTLRNAEEFLKVHKQGKYRFTPIGAIQGWDESSYAHAAKAVVAMGYSYIAIGGLARSNTQSIRRIVLSVRGVVPDQLRIHLFGVSRLSLLPFLCESGVSSIDSAAPIRQAWLRSHDNYYTMDGAYAAIRVPYADARGSDRRLVSRPDVSLESLRAGERQALEALRAYDRGDAGLSETFEAVTSYDELLESREHETDTELLWQRYKKTLKEKPWKRCSCPICRSIGIEVILFRGNNRNRRRGFHNLWIVRQRLNRLAPAKAKAAFAEEVLLKEILT